MATDNPFLQYAPGTPTQAPPAAPVATPTGAGDNPFAQFNTPQEQPQAQPEMDSWYTTVRGRRIEFQVPRGAPKDQVRAVAKSAGVPDPENRSLQFAGKPGNVPKGPTVDQQTNNYGPIGTSIHQGVDFVAPVVDEMAAGGDAFSKLMTGDTNVGENYMNDMRFLQDRAANSEALYPGEALGGKIGAFVGSLPAAAEAEFLKGKSMLSTMLRSGAAGGAYGGTNAYASNPVDDRWNGVPLAAALGTGIGAAAPVLTAVGGNVLRRVDQRLGATDAVRRAYNYILGSPRTSEELANQHAVDVMAARIPQDPSQMRAKAQEMRDLGHEPTVANVVDEGGRGFIAAAARKPGAGRQAAQDAYDARRLSMPERIDRNMEAVINDAAGGDANVQATLKQPVDQTIANLQEKRSADIENALAPIRDTPVPLNPRMFDILNTADGQRAISQAMRTVTDKPTLDAMKSLQSFVRGANKNVPIGLPPSTRDQIIQQLVAKQPMTVDIADRLARKFNAMADTAPADTQRALRGFAREVRDNAKTAVPAYDQALQQYGAASKSIDAVNTGGDFLGPNNADEFVKRAGQLSDVNSKVVTPQETLPGSKFNFTTADTPLGAEHSFEYTAPNGETVKGRIGIDPNDPANAAIEINGKPSASWIGQDANRLGPGAVKDIGRHIAANFPELQSVGGLRVSGARQAAGSPSVAEIDLSRFRNTITQPSDRQLAMQGARRTVQQAAGENISAAPGVARKIAVSPEQSARNNALFGPINADKLERMMAVSEQDLKHYAQIAPNTGSATALRGQDDEMMGHALTAMAHLKAGNPVNAALHLLRTVGMREQDATRIVQMATDPAQTDNLINMLEKSYGKQTAAKLSRVLGLPANIATSKEVGGSR